MSGAELIVLLAAVLLMILLGLHLLVVRPRRRRALRRLVQLRGGHYARGRANLPLSGGEEAFVGAKHLSVPCHYQPEFFLFARSEHPSQPLRMASRELSRAPGPAGCVLPHFGERMGNTSVLELREGRLHLTGHEAAEEGSVERALELALELAAALGAAPCALWPTLHQEHGLFSDPRSLGGRIRGFPVQLEVLRERVRITVRGSFGPLRIQRSGPSGIELENPVLGASLSVCSDDPVEARRRLASQALTTPLLELVLGHDGRVLHDRIEVECEDFGEAAVRQHLDTALTVASAMG